VRVTKQARFILLLSVCEAYKCRCALTFIKNVVGTVATVIRAGVETNACLVGWHNANACYYYLGNTRFGFLTEKRLL
jgi:hypothetical protein